MRCVVLPLAAALLVLLQGVYPAALDWKFRSFPWPPLYMPKANRRTVLCENYAQGTVLMYQLDTWIFPANYARYNIPWLNGTDVLASSPSYVTQRTIATGAPPSQDMVPGGFAMALAGGREVIMNGGLFNSNTSGMNPTWSYSQDGWRILSFQAPVPPGRGWHAMAALGNKSVVMFGGFDGKTIRRDTWVFTPGDAPYGSATWVEFNATTKEGAIPPPRYWHAMAAIVDSTDEDHGSGSALQGGAILFGGFMYDPRTQESSYYSDTWWFGGLATGWMELSPESAAGGAWWPSPSARQGHAMASYAGGVILFGGFDHTKGKPLGDTWKFEKWPSGEVGWQWQRVPTLNEPPGRYKHGMASCAQGGFPGCIVLFGGTGNDGEDMMQDGTWIFNASVSSWESLNKSVAPPSRSQHVVASTGSGALLFGGEGSKASAAIAAETWIYSKAYEGEGSFPWQNKTGRPEGTPKLRFLHAMAAVPREHIDGSAATAAIAASEHDVLLFGGINEKMDAAFVVDDSFQVFGSDECWRWSTAGDKWARVPPSSSCNATPLPRYAHAMAPIGVGGAVLMFGGRAGGGKKTNLSCASPDVAWRLLGDTWLYGLFLSTPSATVTNSSDFRADDGAVTPDPGSGSAAQDAVTARWEQWTPLPGSSQEQPLERMGHAATRYQDGLGDAVVLFGGQGFKGPELDYNEVWLFRYGPQQMVGTSVLSGWHKMVTNPARGGLAAAAPSPRCYHAMATLDANIVLVFGGIEATTYDEAALLRPYEGRPLDDTWMLVASAPSINTFEWKQLLTSRGPASRTTAMAAIGRDGLLLFGGSITAPFAGTTVVTQEASDTWTMLPGCPLGMAPSPGGCAPCAQGTYSNKTDLDNCVACSPGVTTFRAGSEVEQDCGMCQSSTGESPQGACAVDSAGRPLWQCLEWAYGASCEKLCPGIIEEEILAPNSRGASGNSGGTIKAKKPCSGHGTCGLNGECKCTFWYTASGDCSFPALGITVVLIAFVVVFLCGATLRWRRKSGQARHDLTLTQSLLDEQHSQLELEQRHVAEHKEEIGALEEGWRIDFNDLTFSSLIARGGFGEVWLGQWALMPGHDVAIKKISTSPETIDDMLASGAFGDKEIKLMMRTRHKRVVLFLGAGQLPWGATFLVSEYMAGGDLHRLLLSGTPLDWPRRVRIARDVAQGVAFLHSRSLIHRDLKSPNVLLDGHGRAKIADFGLSRATESTRKGVLGKTPLAGSSLGTVSPLAAASDVSNIGDGAGDGGAPELAMTSGTGTVSWMAPELLAQIDTRIATYGLGVDVFSFGVILWELTTRHNPWVEMSTNLEVKNAVLAGERPPLDHVLEASPLVPLMHVCWAQNASDRPTFRYISRALEALQDPAETRSPRRDRRGHDGVSPPARGSDRAGRGGGRAGTGHDHAQRGHRRGGRQRGSTFASADSSASSEEWRSGRAPTF